MSEYNQGSGSNMAKILYVVIPCYNEEEVISETARQLLVKMKDLVQKKKISSKSKVMFVNDGSKDSTWQKILELHQKNKLFTGLCLSRNKGHQNALLAGLLTAKNYADIVISMDADLQDDINAIDEMIEKNSLGAEIVYGVRSSRKKDSFFKRFTAETFYKIMKFLGVDIIFNHADYRLTSKRVLDALEGYEEVNLFLRGIFPLIGYPSSVVTYERHERFAGESKYPLKKMLHFAWDGVTSFSVRPIRLILNLGILIFVISLLVTIYCIVVKLFGYTVDGWTFLACSIWLVGGVTMLSLGVVGEYIGKIYSEVKARPRYHIARNLEEEHD